MASSALARETFFALRREIARIEGRLAERLEAPPQAAGGREQFQEKREQVFRSELHKTKEIERFRDSTKNGNTLNGSATVVRRQGEAEAEQVRIVSGIDRLDANLGGGLLKGALSEFHGRESRDAGAVAGFALSFVSLLLKGLATSEPVLWISLRDFFREAGRPYAPGLAQRFGITPENLLFAATSRLEEALWLAEEASALGRLGAIMLELPGNPGRLDLTATRRLHRRATLAGRPVFLLRQSALAEPTAAPARFVVGPAPASPRETLSGALIGSIGPPAFAVRLSKSPTSRYDDFILEWKADGFLERSRQGTTDHGALVPQPRRATRVTAASGTLLAFEPAAASTLGGQLSRRQRAEDLRAG